MGRLERVEGIVLGQKPQPHVGCRKPQRKQGQTSAFNLNGEVDEAQLCSPGCSGPSTRHPGDHQSPFVPLRR